MAKKNYQGLQKANIEEESTEKESIEFVDDNFSGFTNQHQSTQQQTSHEQIDILFTDEKVTGDGYIYQEIGQFEVVAVLSQQQAKLLNNNRYITAENFRSFTLLTYPLSTDKLDIFKLFLVPAKINPSKVKQVSNSHVMLQMVTANMGVATLPDWLVSSLTQQSLVARKSLGEQGIYKTLYARYYKIIGPKTAK